MEMDELDRLAAEAFRGLSSGRTWCVSFAASFRCRPTSSSSCSAAIAQRQTKRRSPKGLRWFAQQLSTRTVRAGEDELIKSRARETGSARVIDIITARLDAKSDSYLATLPSLRLTDVRLR